MVRLERWRYKQSAEQHGPGTGYGGDDMVMRRWVLAIVACGLIGAGCGDDSGDEGTTPMAGTGAPKAGSSGGGQEISAEMAITGACDMRDELEMCMGIDAFTACTLNDCGGQACADGPCKDWTDCVAAAADPCNNNCTHSAQCNACADPIPDCLVDKCLSKLDCD